MCAVACRGGAPPDKSGVRSKEDLERSYFKDMRDLVEDPSGKFFPAVSYVGQEQIHFALLSTTTPLTQQNGRTRVFTKEELAQRNPHIFIVYQVNVHPIV